MKTILSSVLLFFLVGLVNAEPFTVGGKVLEIPSPKGFSLVTPRMDAVYRLSLQMSDPANDQLAFYIANNEVPVAMSGKIPSLQRYYILKVNKKLKNIVVGSKDFAELKNVTKQQNRKILKSVKAQMPDIMEKTSKGISKEFDIDFAMKMSQMLPLDPHFETDNAFAYSMYINYGVTVEGSKDDLIVSATVTFVNVAGKILFLYCYGSQDELEWTRSASKAWTSMVLDGNAQPPSHSSCGQGFDWGKVLEKAIVGVIVGGLLALFFGIFYRFKRKG